jgi:hypothetical protein
MKIHIFYRHFNIQGNDFKNRPNWFDFERCFVNLLSTIENKNIDLHVIMDGEINSNFISKYTDKFISHQIIAGSDHSSFFQTWKIAKETNINDLDLIYFLENDYLHVPDWSETVLELFSAYNLPHYVSLYDHKDKYFEMYDNLVSKIFITETRHWRTTPSTCGSFIINKQLFDADYDIHTTFIGDHHKFLQLNSQRNRIVITPIPGLSTHCMEGLLSPTIKWNNIC